MRDVDYSSLGEHTWGKGVGVAEGLRLRRLYLRLVALDSSCRACKDVFSWKMFESHVGSHEEGVVTGNGSEWWWYAQFINDDYCGVAKSVREGFPLSGMIFNSSEFIMKRQF